MEGEIFVITLVSIICATGLIKAWINRQKEQQAAVDEESFNRLARAFMQHKKEMTERIQNIEAVLSDSNEKSVDNFQQIEAPNNDKSLTNDLQQKDRVRS